MLFHAMAAKFKLPGKERVYEVEPDRIALNNVIFPGEYNPHKVRLWVLGNQFGVMGAVWADNMSDAFDELVDQDLGAGILVDEDDYDEDEREDLARLGNAGEPADMQYAWADTVKLAEADLKLIVALAEGRGAGADFLD